MALPGFTAEASAYRTTGHYAMGPQGGDTGSQIIPMDLDSCGSCHCTDPSHCCRTTTFGGCECYYCGIGGPHHEFPEQPVFR